MLPNKMQQHPAPAKVSDSNNRHRSQRDQGRHFSFTSFNGEIAFNMKSMKYLCQAPEICPTTGRQHHQGYVIFKSERTRSSVRKELPNIDIDLSYAPAENNIRYIEGPYDDGKGKTKPYNPDFKENGVCQNNVGGQNHL